MTDEFVCKYCGKVCKNNNSLRQHEIRCKMNPLRITFRTDNSIVYGGFKKGTKTWVYKNNKSILISIDKLSDYISDGWIKGISASYKQKISNALIDKEKISDSNHKRTYGFKKGTRTWVHKNDKSILISIEKLSDYISDGWVKGISNVYKQKLSKSLIGKSCGTCKDPIKEQERRQKISNTMKGNTNWKFNKHHGNAKQGRYNGIICDSTWELAYLVYHVEHNLYIERCKEKRTYIYKGEQHTYIPDFITNAGIVEIKGRITEQSIQKQIQNTDIKVIHTEEINPYLDYVITKYGNEFWKVLYDK